MSIVKMKKLSLAVYNHTEKEVLRSLQHLGFVHLDDVEEVEDLEKVIVNEEKINNQLSSIENAIKFIKQNTCEEKAGFLESFGAYLPSISLHERNNFSYKDIEESLKEIERVANDYKQTQTTLINLQTEVSNLLPWKNVGVDLDIVNKRTRFISGCAGYVLKDQENAFLNEVKENEYIEINKAFETATESYFYLLYPTNISQDIEKHLSEISFINVKLSGEEGSLCDTIHKLNRLIGDTEFKISLYKCIIVDFLDNIPTFEKVYDKLLAKKTRMYTSTKSISSEMVHFYEGYIPARESNKLIKTLDNIEGISYELNDISKEETENTPLLLSNHLFAPYEGLTKMFGTPVYGKTVDPTPHFAPFYFIFYGFCLSDIGYGLLLTLLGFFLAIVARKNHSKKEFMTMLGLSGLSSIIFGFIFGSFFGDLFVNYLPIKGFENVGLLDALGKPLVVLYVSLILGMIQLYYGVILKWICDMRVSFIDGFCDNFPWLVFLIGFFGWIVLVWIGGMAEVPVPPTNIVHLFYDFMIAGAILVLLNAMRNGFKHGIVKGLLGFLGGLWELYGASSYLSNLLSYARLLALALSTGVIANVFNQLAFDMLIDKMPGIGLVLGIILLLVGHVFNLVLSAFGAFVHSLRLQFVEFFGEFVESGGKEFSPIRDNGLYYDVKEEI